MPEKLVKSKQRIRSRTRGHTKQHKVFYIRQDRNHIECHVTHSAKAFKKRYKETIFEFSLVDFTFHLPFVSISKCDRHICFFF